MRGTKGDIAEFKALLHAKGSKIDALKQIVAAMTLGKDVSALFPDVLQCMHSSDIEQKKLVYLYLMNYARRSPQLALMSVQQFNKDSSTNPDPLVRGLAIRTMGCMRVDNMLQYLGDPLRKALKDTDPYVRKTAAIAIAKLYDLDSDLVEEQGFLDVLRDLINDSNSMVIANAIAALQEIDAASENQELTIDLPIANKLLLALGDSSEWGQVYILNALARFLPEEFRQARNIVNRISARLKHANSAVVLASVRILLRYLDAFEEPEFQRWVLKLLGPPLVTLLSSNPEVQYVALRNIILVIRKYPNLLTRDLRMFFCKYNDPIYVKLEKLEIMIQLANEKNVEKLLAEFREYCLEEVDVEFVRKSVAAIGRCAIKIDSAADRCVRVLLDLVERKSRASYIVQESIIVIRDIFRRYPGRYEKVITKLFPHLESLDLPEAKAAMIWIIGEYADGISNAGEILQQFAKNWQDEPAFVQLQILTSAVKVLLYEASESNEQFLHTLLAEISEKNENPDLRDRCFMYWRLLTADSAAAADILLAQNPTIVDDTQDMEPQLLNQLLSQLGCLSSVYHKPATTFVPKQAIYSGYDASSSSDDDDDDDGDDADDTSKPPNTQNSEPDSESDNDDEVVTATTGTGDLVDLGLGEPTPAAIPTIEPFKPETSSSMFSLYPGEQNHPVSIIAQIATSGENMSFQLIFRALNPSQQSILQSTQVSFNSNAFGLLADNTKPYPISPQGAAAIPIVISRDHINSTNGYVNVFEIALKTELGMSIVKSKIPFSQLWIGNPTCEQEAFISTWQASAQSEVKFTTTDITYTTDTLKNRLLSSNVFIVTERQNGTSIILYIYCRTLTAADLYGAIAYDPSTKTINSAIRSQKSYTLSLFQEALTSIYTS